MNSLRVLLKATFTNDYGLNGLSKEIATSKDKKKILTSLFVMLIGALTITYLVVLYALLMANGLEQIGLLDMILIMGIMISTIIVLFSSIYKAQGILFTSRDYDLLMSLPIKNSVILISKLINLLLMNWVFTIFAMVPVSIIYFIRVDNVSWMYFIILIIGIIFMPLIPVVLASIIAAIISYFASKFKYMNVIIILGTIVFMLSFMIGSFYMQDVMNYIMANSSSIMDMISKIYLPSAYFTKALVNVDFVELIKFVIISVLPFIAFILVFSKSFKTINSRFGEVYKNANYKMKSLKTGSLLKSLTYKELKRYFSTPIYVLNTAVGMIILIVAAIATLFFDGETLAMYMEIPYAKDIFPLMILVMMIFSIGLSTTTSSSLSLEGKMMWIMKSLPIREKDIFISKIALNLWLTLPLNIIANILFFMGLKYSLGSFVWNIVISSLYCFCAAVFGLLINLYFPKLEWTSPTVVVKQSASVMINILVTFGVIALPIGGFILLKVSNLTPFLWVILIVEVLVLLAVWYALNSKGIEKFKEL